MASNIMQYIYKKYINSSFGQMDSLLNDSLRIHSPTADPFTAAGFSACALTALDDCFVDWEG